MRTAARGCGGARTRSSRSGCRTARGRTPSRSSARGRGRDGREALSSRSVIERYSVRAISSTVCSPCACRSGRPASPTSSASPVSTSHGSSAARWSVTRYAWCATRVAGGGDRLDLRVAELDDLSVLERRDARTRRPRPPGRYAVAPVRATSSAMPETWSACTCVSSTATIGAPCASASAMYSSTRSTCGSTTAKFGCVVQPNRYDAHAVSSLSNCRKNTPTSRRRIHERLDKLSTDLLNSKENMTSEKAKSALFEAIAVMGKAFASPVRLELLDLLAQAPRTVDELARASGQSTANTSQHLQALHAAGMVTRAREGTSVRYALAGRRGAVAVAGAARRLGRPAGRGRACRPRLPRRRRSTRSAARS